MIGTVIKCWMIDRVVTSILDHFINITTEIGSNEGLYYEMMFVDEDICDILMVDVKLISDDGEIIVVNDGFGEFDIPKRQIMMMELIDDQSIIDEINVDIATCSGEDDIYYEEVIKESSVCQGRSL